MKALITIATESRLPVGCHSQRQPRHARQRGADQNVAFAPAAKERKRVGQDAGERFQVPSEPGPEKERGVGGPVYVQFVFQQILKRQPRQHLRLCQGRGKHAGDNNKCGIHERPVGPKPGVGSESHGQF
jgi:hypothetical protein